MYAEMGELDNDHRPEIIAVLDPEGGSQLQELGSWHLTTGSWTVVDKIVLLAVKEVEYPTIEAIVPLPHSAAISLTYPEQETLTCRYLTGKITCEGDGERVKETTNAQ